jgi:hypothetical protein
VGSLPTRRPYEAGKLPALREVLRHQLRKSYIHQKESAMRQLMLFSISMLLWVSTVLTAQTPTLQEQLKDVEVGDHWIYNDFQAAVAKAKSEGKPLFVLFR